MARGSTATALRHAVLAARATCAKMLQKLSTRRPRPQVSLAMAASDNPVFSCGESSTTGCQQSLQPEVEDAKSRLTVVSWLDDVADLEDMDNRFNEALEAKAAAGNRRGCSSG